MSITGAYTWEDISSLGMEVYFQPIYNVEKGSYKPVLRRSWAAESALPRVSSIEGGFRINVIPSDAKATVLGLDAAEVLRLGGAEAGRCGVVLSACDVKGGAELSVHGRQAHAATPWEGVNGNTALLSILASLPLADCADALAKAPGVKGRIEVVPVPADFAVIIDYAHTPDALENVCKTLKELCSRRLITVFGCGGDRDKGKRPLMGAVAARLSDACIVTSDNPRSEEPLSIINQITAGMPEGRYAIIPDRARAIATAIDQARLGDIVLIAGKGHENYQELSTGRIDFSDAKEVRRNMRIKDEFTQA